MSYGNHHLMDTAMNGTFCKICYVFDFLVDLVPKKQAGMTCFVTGPKWTTLFIHINVYGDCITNKILNVFCALAISNKVHDTSVLNKLNDEPYTHCYRVCAIFAQR